MKIIDVGCGPGIYVKALRELGYEVDGIDPDPRWDALKTLKNKN